MRREATLQLPTEVFSLFAIFPSIGKRMFRQSPSVEPLRLDETVPRAKFVPGRTGLIPVNIATHRDSEKLGLNRKGRKSAPKRAKRGQNVGTCCLHRVSGRLFCQLPADWVGIRSQQIGRADGPGSSRQ